MMLKRTYRHDYALSENILHRVNRLEFITQQYHKEQNMLIKKIISSIVLVLVLAILIQGCNTMRGAGQDIEKAGEAIEDAAK